MWTYIIYIIYVHMTGNITIFIAPAVTVFISSPRAGLLQPIVIYNFYPYTQRKTFFLFLFFYVHRNLSHCRHRYRAIGRRWPRLRTDPSHRLGELRGRGAPPLECGPRVLSSTSSSPVSSDTSFGWCSIHESPRVYLFYAIIVFRFFPRPAHTRMACKKMFMTM